MEPLVISFCIIGLLFVLLATGIPIFVCLGFCGMLGLLLVEGPKALFSLGSIPFYDLFTFTLTALPLFVFMGEILYRSKIGEVLYGVGSAWLGRLPGGLAMGSVIACAIFGAMCGSAVAGAVTIGLIAVPEMTKRDYNRGLATATLASAGPLAILIPPSGLMIVYGELAEVSVGRLFIAGIIPGIILAILMIIYIGIRCSLDKSLAPPMPPISWRQRISSLRGSWVPVVLILGVLGSIYMGICTPTESAAVGALLALLISAFIYRTLNWSTFQEAAKGTLRTTAFIWAIIGCAAIFGHFIAIAGLSQLIANLVSGIGSVYLVLIVISAVIFIMGCFLDPLGTMLITMPAVLPALNLLGVDLIWFGILVLINMEAANVTPPVGFTLYVIHGISKVPVGEIIKDIIPFVFIFIVLIGIIMAFPKLALWLPGMMR